MSKKNNNNQPAEKSEIKSIKYGIISQNSTLIKISDLFKYYFEKSNATIIKSEEKEYEFTLESYKDIHYIFRVLNEDSMKNIFHIYSSLNFFLIFIDIQSTVALKNLENYVDKLISCSQDITKKSYIFGAFKDSNLIVNSDEKISTILNCKGIDYEYSEININLNEDFPKGMEYIIEDSKEIMEEMKSDELMEKREEEKQRSCNIV